MPTTTPEKLQMELRDTLEATGYVQVTAMASYKGDARVMFRVRKGQEGYWLQLLHQYLLEEPESWYSLIGQKYMIVNRELRYGWVMIVDGDNLETVITGVRKLFMSVYTAQTGKTLSSGDTPVESEGEEVPLPHSNVYTAKSQKNVRKLGA